MKEGMPNKLPNTTKKIRCVRVEDKAAIIVNGFNAAAKLVGISPDKVRYNINRKDKVFNGFMFFDY